MASPDEVRTESKSSVAIGMNSKGEATPSVKVYVGDKDEDVEHALELAVATFRTACERVRS